MLRGFRGGLSLGLVAPVHPPPLSFFFHLKHVYSKSSKLVSDFAPPHAFSSERVLKETLKLRNLNDVA